MAGDGPARRSRWSAAAGGSRVRERLGAIGFILLFYLCNPPFVGYFYSIPSEGSYLIVNKNLVELGALVVILVTGSGRYAGLDRIVSGLLGRLPKRVTA